VRVHITLLVSVTGLTDT